jgi:hypothetical protein
VIAGAGFGFLWWQGIIQPFLKELACYVTWQHYVGQGQGGLACRLRAIAPDGHVVPGDRTKVYLGLIVSLLVGVIFAELWSKFFAPCLHFEAFRGL